MIALDTQWWLQAAEHKKPGAACAFGDEDAVIGQVKQLLQTAQDRLVIVVGHHLLESHGRHGGFFTWRDHLFPLTHLVAWLYLPLPVIGSIYPIARWHWVENNQDLNGPLNRHMVTGLTKAMSASPPLIYASGHDHSLQVLDGAAAARYLLISGGGSAAKISGVSHGNDTLFAHSHPGFMAIELMVNGEVLLRVVEPGETGVVWMHWLHPHSP